MTTYATVKTVWDAPALLQAPLRAVFRPAVGAAAAAMQAVHPKTVSMRVLSATDTAAAIKGGGLASVWEHGRKAGYDIRPKTGAKAAGGQGSGALMFRTGGYQSGGLSSHVSGGAEAAKPFMLPIASRFQADFYNPLARAAIGRSGAGLAGRLLG